MIKKIAHGPFVAGIAAVLGILASPMYGGVNLGGSTHSKGCAPAVVRSATADYIVLNCTEAEIDEYINVTLPDCLECYVAKFNRNRNSWDGVKALGAAISKAPNDARLYAMRIGALRALDDANGANVIGDYSKLIELEPNDISHYLDRCSTRVEMQYGVEKAIDDCKYVIDRDSASAAAYFYRGMAQYLQKQFKPAIDDFSESIRLDPGKKYPKLLGRYKPTAVLFRGMAYRDSGELDKAFIDYRVAAREDYRIWDELASMYIQSNDKSNAYECLEKSDYYPSGQSNGALWAMYYWKFEKNANAAVSKLERLVRQVDGCDGPCFDKSKYENDLGGLFATEEYKAMEEKSSPTRIAARKAASYPGFLSRLDVHDISSILKAKKEFLTRYSSAPVAEVEEAFRAFMEFYDSTINECASAFSDKHVSSPALNAMDELTKDPWGDPLKKLATLKGRAAIEFRQKYSTEMADLIKYSDSGVRFSQGEGMWGIEGDPQFLLKAFPAGLESELRDYLQFIVDEDYRTGEDAGLVIPWEKVRERIIHFEKFYSAHPNLPESTSEIEPDLKSLVGLYLAGVDNTRAYDILTGQFSEELKRSYEAFLEENESSSYSPIIKDVYEILQRHKFKLNKEVLEYMDGHGYASQAKLPWHDFKRHPEWGNN